MFQTIHSLQAEPTLPIVIYRERELQYFTELMLNGIKESYLPPMIRVYGAPGTGKTLVVRKALSEVQITVGSKVFDYVYVNLKKCRTTTTAANQILEALSDRQIAKNLGIDRIFQEIWFAIQKRRSSSQPFYLALILDEIDTVFLDKHYIPSDFLYRLVRYPESLREKNIKITTIAITNTINFIEDHVDGRILSSMGKEVITFPAYTYDELLGILAAYSVQVFQPNHVKPGVYEACARHTAFITGDARQALDLLRLSGTIANSRNSPITPDCVTSAIQHIDTDQLTNIISTLSPLEVIVLLAAAHYARPTRRPQKDRIYSVDVYRQYIEFIDLEPNLPRVTDRRLLEVLHYLETLGLIRLIAYSRGRLGRVLEVQLKYEPVTIIDACQERKRNSKLAK